VGAPLPDPQLPFKLGRSSNGEFVPPPLDGVRREAMRRARQLSDDTARRLGWDRRRFLTSACGMATGLVALQACADEARQANPTTTGPGGRFDVPTTATTEPELATTTTHAPEGTLLVDVQNHFLDYELHPDAPTFGDGFPQASCDAGDSRECFTPERWADLVFLQSDTTMAVLSAIPIVGDANPLSIAAMERGRQVARDLCGDERVLVQGHAVPDVGDIEVALAAMRAVAAEHRLSAWKVYTHAPNGWYLDDHDPSLPQVGERFLGEVEASGTPVVAVHKGLAGGSAFASPVDVGPAAARHPDIRFLVYHSGYETGVTEGPYDPAGQGVDRLVASVAAAGVGAGSNVYAELGSTWRQVMGDVDQAAHLLGKLMLAVGEDNVLWGTDSIWYGSPQDQIAAFQAFEITTEFQERFGYPALTAERKAKILGLNAVRALNIARPVSGRCSPAVQSLQRRADPFVNRTNGPVSRRDVLATFVREHPWVLSPGGG
jgi:uncharacterized protein